MTRHIRRLAAALAFAAMLAGVAAEVAAETVTGITETFGGYTLSVPVVEIGGERIDAGTVETFFALGQAFLQARMLKDIVAADIRIPELTVEGTFGMPGVLAAGVAEGQLMLRDIEIKNLADGLAGQVSIGSIGYYLDGFTVETGSIAAVQVNLGFLADLLGIGQGRPADFEMLFNSLSIEELSVLVPGGSCAADKIAMGGVALRAMRHGSLSALASLHPVSGDDYAQLMALSVDAASAVAAEAVAIDAMHCDFTVDGKPGTVAFDSLRADETHPGTIPYFVISGLRLDDGEDALGVATLTIGAIAYDGMVAAYGSLGDTVATAAWAAAQGRKLWPRPEGIELAGVETSGMTFNLMGQPAPANFGKIRLDLGEYRDGIPVALTLQIEDAVVPAKAGAEPSRLAEILGTSDISVDIMAQTAWKEALQAIPIALTIGINDRASLALTIWLGRARAALFSEDAAASAAAAFGLTVTSASLDIADPGLTLYALDSIAEQIGTDPAEMRNQLMEQVQTVIMDGLRPEQDPLSISAPIVAFLGGAEKLMLSATSAVAGGVPLTPLLVPGADLSVLLPYLNITARSEPLIGN